MTANKQDRQEGRSANSGFAKKRVQWLIEHSTSHQILWYVDSLVLRNPLLRKAANRYCKAAWGTTRENIDSVCLALFTDRQALRNLTALKFITFASARITISLRHYS
jgi:hypothetical protein